MDAFTIFRALKGNLNGIKNYLTFIKKNDGSKPKLFVDITEVRQNDSGTGVPRVTNNILKNLYTSGLSYEIVEVYGKSHNEGFFDRKTNKPIKVRPGDFFFGLDFSKFQIPKNKKYLDKMFKNGIPVWFFVHDMIPHFYPQYCTESVVKSFDKWIHTIIHYTGFIANSKTTLEETNKWIKEQPAGSYNPELKSDYVHLGCSFNNAQKKPMTVKEKLQFISVSAVARHKKFDQIIKAFDILWNKGFDVSLQIVGHEGWNNQSTTDLIKNNPHFGKELIWHEKYISDQELENLYDTSCALIFASETEGFGMPLIEAACNGLPLIIRDIPVFHEVTGDQATFFSGFAPENLSDCIEKWIENYRQGKIQVADIKLYSWKECTDEVILKLKIK